MNDVRICAAVELAAPDTFAAHAGSLRVAALYHKVGDNSVELESVVVALLGELDEVLNALVRIFREKSELYGTVVLNVHYYYSIALFGGSKVCDINIFNCNCLSNCLSFGCCLTAYIFGISHRAACLFIMTA